MILLLVAGTGCDSGSNSGSSGSGTSMDDLAAQLDSQEAARQQEIAAAEKKAQDEAAAASAATENAPTPEVVTARSGKKGQSLQGGGYLSVATGTRFWAENQMTLNMIRKNMDLYQAEHGEYPKTQEEFMQKIIEEGLIELPELPEGYEYFYDPKEPLVLKMINTGAGQPGVLE
jgi:hypothetical protein